MFFNHLPISSTIKCQGQTTVGVAGKSKMVNWIANEENTTTLIYMNSINDKYEEIKGCKRAHVSTYSDTDVTHVSTYSDIDVTQWLSSYLID